MLYFLKIIFILRLCAGRFNETKTRLKVLQKFAWLENPRASSSSDAFSLLIRCTDRRALASQDSPDKLP